MIPTDRWLQIMASVALALTFLRADPAWADQDAIEPPWGTIHGDLSGTAATDAIPYNLGEGPMEEKWRLDVVALGHDRAGGRSSIVFDRDGNLYWISSSGGGTGGVIRLLSVSPDGKLRWFGNDGAGAVHPIGTVFSGASPVVGAARVYATGDQASILALAAYDKATGRNLWTTDLFPSGAANNQVLTPALYQGKLYAVGLNSGKSRDVHRVDAETGDLDWSSTIPEVEIAAVGQIAFVPDAFGNGEHGIYFNGDSGSGTDGIAEVYGLRITDTGAALGWKSDGGKAARSHVIYSAGTDLLYTLTWADYNGELYVFDPRTGLVNAYNNKLRTGHGFYDVGALDFDGSIIAGGFDGYILRYIDNGFGELTDSIIYKGGTAFPVPYWGETRVLGQLVLDPAGSSILISGTNSFQCCPSHVIAVDATNGKRLWEYDTGSRSDHQFLYAGGPILGPDGKIYYFERPAGGSTALVAIGPAAAEPSPTAGFIVVDARNQAAGEGVEPCIRSGETARFDGSCSTGKNLIYRYTVDPPESAIILPRSESDSAAEIRFISDGLYEITLTVENEAGSAACKRNVCAVRTPPSCQLSVADEVGARIDDADDGDAIPCLPAGGTAVVTGEESLGGNLEYDFSISPPQGVSIDQVDSNVPRARITFAIPGSYRVNLSVTNNLGISDCIDQTICVKEDRVTDRFLRGDCNSDGLLDISDAVTHLGALFLGDPPPSCPEACNANGDDLSDISDAVYLLGHLFLGDPPPPAPFPACAPDPDPGNLGCGQPQC